jgi:hypothetical protein
MNKVIDIQKTKKYQTEKTVRNIFAGFFVVSLLVSIGYWLYTLYEIYETNFNSLQNAGNVWHYMKRNIVAFEAAILSFFLFVAALKI